jgi:hypothetical protein
MNFERGMILSDPLGRYLVLYVDKVHFVLEMVDIRTSQKYAVVTTIDDFVRLPYTIISEVLCEP